MRQAFLLITIIAALSLQIQVTLFATASYAGLRVSLADLFLPLIVAGIALTLLSRKSDWPEWKSRATLPLIAALILVMTLSIAQSALKESGNFKWALINKYIGFLILMAYLFLGAWLARNAPKSKEVFSQYFAGFFIITLCLSFFAFFIQPLIPVLLWLDRYPWDGFMANRNAFALLAIFAILLLLNAPARPKPDIHAPTPFLRRITDPDVLLWLLLPIFFIYNASRAGWIACALITFIWAVKSPRQFLRQTLPVLLIGALLAYGSLYIQSIRDVQKNKQFGLLLALGDIDEENMYGGDRKRLIAVEDGLELYKASNPLIGSGLGTYKDYQIEKRGKFIDLIDFTALWLLVETGALGLLAFTAFFVHCLMTLWRTSRSPPVHERNFERALLYFLIIFAAFSFLHEILYTRYLWLALGLALAKPSEKEIA